MATGRDKNIIFLLDIPEAIQLPQSHEMFKKMGQSRPLFVHFRYFLNTISIIQIEKSVDGVLGIRTWGRRTVGANETTELWRLVLCVQQASPIMVSDTSDDNKDIILL